MSLTWIVTSGNSDVILTSKQSWCSLRTQKNNQLCPCEDDFSELPPVPGYDDRFTLPARVLGILYGDTWDTHEKYFEFPLLEEFILELQKENKYPDRIIVLLTNQENIFSEDSEDPQYDRCEDSPYWRDTCELESIFKNYFDREFGKDKVEFIYLKPKTRNEGLDNWDSALDLVQEQFKQIKAEKDDRFIISHQAGTPAISSAVQFASLSRFNNVTFLIGNERDKDLTRFLGSSSYLRGIEIQQAKKLLENYDYSGMKEVLKKQIKEANKPKEKHKLEDEILKHISYLLDIAVQWNFAKFEDFAQALSSYSEQNLVKQNQAYLQDVELAERAKAYLQNPDQYWWTAYEAAYLGVIRLEQDNTVEALFHSFRSVEGLMLAWAIWKYKDSHVKHEKDNYDNWCWFIYQTIRQELPNYRKKDLSKEGSKIKLYSQSLYDLLSEGLPATKDNPDLSIFLKDARPERNQLFHQLLGLNKSKVYEAWGITAPKEDEPLDEWKKVNLNWQERIIKCLNAVSGQDFSSLEQASIMAQVHQELIKAIDSL